MQSDATLPKSPFTLLILIGILIISTLVVLSNYFVRPGLELSIRNEISENLREGGLGFVIVSVDGRDVVLKGNILRMQDATKAGNIVSKIQGVRVVENQLALKKESIE